MCTLFYNGNSIIEMLAVDLSLLPVAKLITILKISGLRLIDFNGTCSKVLPINSASIFKPTPTELPTEFEVDPHEHSPTTNCYYNSAISTVTSQTNCYNNISILAVSAVTNCYRVMLFYLQLP